MPKPSPEDGDTASKGLFAGSLAAMREYVWRTCEKLGVESHLLTVAGPFEATLPATVTGPIALLHADGDWYYSTRSVLENLYDRVVVGGFIQIDDYHCWQGCAEAVHEFENKRGLRFDLHTVDEGSALIPNTAVWFKKK
jgi:hypothetical protein